MLPAAVLGDALRTRTVATAFEPHIRTFLEEVPLSLISKVVDQLNAEHGAHHDEIWSNIRTLARSLKVFREL